MALSAFDLFSIGIGPSSSHTVGPMRAARMFAHRLKKEGALASTASLRAELFGSLGATGHGHGTPKAVLLGLEGHAPDTVDVDTADAEVDRIREQRRLRLLGTAIGDSHTVAFDPATDLVLHRRRSLPYHANGMTLCAYDRERRPLLEKTYYSVGGGFVVDEDAVGEDRIKLDDTQLRHPFRTGDELLRLTRETGLSVSALMLENELAWRSEAEIRAGLLEIWGVMEACVARGLTREGILPGGLKVRRRAAQTARQLRAEGQRAEHTMEWVTLYAMAVNEENAAGGRVVTAPTNGAAGIIPAVLHYYTRFVPGADDDGVVRFLLAASAIGMLFKENASISGAEVGCQGEVGSACSMAAGGLAEVLGATAEQMENAAEIGIEHNLGLTCDPVGGLVQIPCIERNGMAAVKAVTAARMSLRGDGRHHVSLDKAIKTMKETGADMKVKYKETARGGLAVNVIEC
ncbi:L-serine ammonia-lyase [Streptomyces bohaiensis]|uniref:L-serine dehydratase n=1 Tax=Streptomyces bohaiensis TaxID=1431344 RepID=A0ABX1C463_9ACTN|nr:L-serine ammonia-lyase [Streptomyces bohaiensis]NJQ14011.1 L-serine ammonia-lyase [Streptomyces bohaiensis]